MTTTGLNCKQLNAVLQYRTVANTQQLFLLISEFAKEYQRRTDTKVNITIGEL